MVPVVYTMFITNNHASFQFWWEENLLNIKNSQNILTWIADTKVSCSTNYLEFYDQICSGRLFLAEKTKKDEQLYSVLHIQIMLGTKYSVKLTSFKSWVTFTKTSIFGRKR